MLRIILFLSICLNTTGIHAMPAKKPGASAAQTAPAKVPAKAPAAPGVESKTVVLLDSGLLEEKEQAILRKITSFLDEFAQYFQKSRRVDDAVRIIELKAAYDLVVVSFGCVVYECHHEAIDLHKIMAVKIPGYGTLVRKAIKLGYPLQVIKKFADFGTPILSSNSENPDFVYTWNCWENQYRENILKWLLEQDTAKPHISDLGLALFPIMFMKDGENWVNPRYYDENGQQLKGMIDRCIAQTDVRKRAEEEKTYITHVNNLARSNTLQEYGARDFNDLPEKLVEQDEVKKLGQRLGRLESN